MARRYYGINRGQTEFDVTDSDTQTGRDLEVSLELDNVVEPINVQVGLELLIQKILAGPWPAAAAPETSRKWGIDVNQPLDTAIVDGPLFAFLENQGIRYDSRVPGAVATTIALEDPGGNDEPLDVTVTDDDIVVSLETDSGGDIVSTADDVVAALLADPDAMELISVSGGGATPLVPLVETQLAGGLLAVNSDITAEVLAAAGFETAEMVFQLQNIRNHVIKNIWQPA